MECYNLQKSVLLCLPSELINLIVEYINNKDLCSLIRTSKNTNKFLLKLSSVKNRLDKKVVYCFFKNRLNKLSYSNKCKCSEIVYRACSTILQLQKNDIYDINKNKLCINHIILYGFYGKDKDMPNYMVYAFVKNVLYCVYLLSSKTLFAIDSINSSEDNFIKDACTYAVNNQIANYDDVHIFFLVKRQEYMALSFDDICSLNNEINDIITHK
jgi:hypothetical protein